MSDSAERGIPRDLQQASDAFAWTDPPIGLLIRTSLARYGVRPAALAQRNSWPVWDLGNEWTPSVTVGIETADLNRGIPAERQVAGCIMNADLRMYLRRHILDRP